jgi:hypothetical protein
MVDELEKDLEGNGFSISRYCTGIHVEWLKKTALNFSQSM